MLGSLTLIILAIVIFRSHTYFHFTISKKSSARIAPANEHHLSSLIPEASEPLDQMILEHDEGIPKDELDEHIDNEFAVREYIVSAGDTLTSVLTQYDVNVTDIVKLAKQYPSIHYLKVGQSLSWTLTGEGNLQRLVWNISRHETKTYDRIGHKFKETITSTVGEWSNIILFGQLNENFAKSALSAGLTSSDIRAVIKALQWQIDFRKLRKKDIFSVILSRETQDKKNSRSQLLGVHLYTGGKDYYAFHAENGKFYNLHAVGVPHGFMRFPTAKQFRISSNFNLHRLNPVINRTAPHRGVDFAVPIGTPVLAVGDGEVIVSKRDSAAGNYITIRHAGQYMTRYMHLKILLVQAGQQVRRGDCIALSGNTGRSTGPHLHYEVWINHQAVNPLTAKLPNVEELTGSARDKYFTQVKKILPKLQFK